MKIQTINQLVSVFKDIATRHYQINGFGIGDSWEIGADKAYMHPVLWINPVTANMPSTDTGYKTFEINFEVRVFDLVHKDESNENDVLSDTIDILKDIIVEFRGHPYYVNSQLNIVDDISFEAFTEEFDEEVSGWLCEISLMTPVLTSFCGIPATDISGFEFPDINCPDVNVLCPVLVTDVIGTSPITVTTDGTVKTISIDTSSLPDTFVISSILNGTDLELTRNDGVTITTDLSSLAGGSVTADNGLNISTGNDVELGGTLNKTTTVSGGYQVYTMGTLASKLSSHNINSIEGLQTYSDSGYKLEVTDNPGGRYVEFSSPSPTTNSYSLNPAGFKLDIDTTYNSDFELYEYLTVDSGNFEIDRYDGLITFDDDLGNNELNTLTFDSNLNSQVVGDNVDESSFVTSKSSLELKKTNTSGKESYHLIDDAKLKMYREDTAVSEEGYFQIYGDFIEYKHTNSNGNEGQMFLGSNNFQMNYETPGNPFGGSITIWPDKVTLNSNSYGFFSIGPDSYFQDFRTTTRGIEYLADYSAGYTSLSLITKGDLDAAISSIIPTLWEPGTGTDSINYPNSSSANTLTGNQSVILGGGGNTNGGVSSIIISNDSEITTAQNSTIVGGENNVISSSGLNNSIFGTVNATITTPAQFNSLFGGVNIDISGPANNNEVFGGVNNSITNPSANNVIVGGTNNEVDFSSYSFLISGGNNSLTGGGSAPGPANSGIIGGDGNTIDHKYSVILNSKDSSISRVGFASNGIHNNILGGQNNTITVDTNSDNTIVGGNTNAISSTAERSVILGGQNITATQDDMAYVQNLEVQTGLAKYSTDPTVIAGFDALTLVNKDYVDTAITNIPTFTADYCRGSKTIGVTNATYVSLGDQTIPITVESENSDSSKFTVVSNGVQVNQDGRYRVNCATSINSNTTPRANPIMSIAVNGVIVVDGNGEDYQSVEHYARNAGSAKLSSSQLDLILDLNENDIVTIIMSVGGINAQSGVQILSEGTFLEVCEVVATQNTSGFTGTFTNGDGDTVTVSNGIITNIA
ncbi:MAG: hypothetical protein Unbinned706contig1001_3 [Prokaryotic dsDNA virus sp.]|nr:MAG: hypothetical protein Unbinned706contig1001_3 [Prokaryotic dsDNA virus sp.]|tara:strand:- start:4831 stop:7938 length:3108 start_codon:yes stop_codon:yes gene_type:complete